MLTAKAQNAKVLLKLLCGLRGFAVRNDFGSNQRPLWALTEYTNFNGCEGEANCPFYYAIRPFLGQKALGMGV